MRVEHGDCLDVMRRLADEGVQVDAVVTDPPYGLEFMGKDWDSFAPRDRKNATVWDGRRQAQEGWQDSAASRSGKGGGGPSYAAKSRPGKRCRLCGRRAFSGTPCVCAAPEWELEHRQEAPSAMLGFQAFSEAWARAAYDLLKPGGHLLVFAGSRTYHRMVCGLEDAGFEIRDSLCWLYGTGFPKSLDVSKAIDKAAGAEREVVGRRTDRAAYPKQNIRGGRLIGGINGAYDGSAITAPATDAARQWEGWGTALKPAHEPICLARKPLAEPTVAAQVSATGTGAINVDACRVGIDPAERDVIDNRSGAGFGTGNSLGAAIGRAEGVIFKSHSAGRWPPNVAHDGSPEVLEAFARYGTSKDGVAGKRSGTSKIAAAGLAGYEYEWGGYGGEGTAARFFYSAKASKQDRAGSKHPTVKPVALMRWLCRLVTPPGGLILDPFAGSGTTGQAAREEGFDAILIEREAEYYEDIKRRLTSTVPPLFAEAC